MKRLLPYLVFATALSMMTFYGNSLLLSPSGEFNVTAEVFFANWTNSYFTDGYAFNISVGNNLSTWLSVNISNATLIRNSAGFFADLILANNTPYPDQMNISAFNFTNVTIRFNFSLLSPGRYTGNISITNSTSANSKISAINLTLDIPITINQTVFKSNSFFGNISVSSKFDVFFFNSTGASGVYVNVNDSDADLLLFDNSGVLVAYNNTNSSLNRTLLYPFLAYNSYYELRVFYNNTNASMNKYFNGIIEFSPLNSSARFLDFGQVNASPDAANPARITFNLNNTNQVNLSTVTETKQIYRIERFVNRQNSTNFTIPVAGNYVSIDAMLEWNNASADFNLTIYNSSGYPLVNQSKRRDMFNASVGFDRIFSRAVVGMTEYNNSWRVSVTGDSRVYYNLTVRINIAATWLSSSFGNYSGLFIFNATQNNTVVDFNVTVPLLSVDGQYNGTLTYRSETGNYMAIPFGVNVTAPVLMVNNTFSKILISVTDNVGTNKTLDYTLFINNTGTYALTLNDTNSTSLNNSGSDTVSFNYSFANPVSARGSSLFRIRLNITTQTTSAGESVYYGWIKLNASNAHPYNDFLVNIALNLTNKLNVIVSNVANQTDKGVWINPINKTENYTTLTTADPVFVNVTVNVTYQNGTFVSILNATNFTVWLQSEFPYEGSNFTQNFTSANVSNVIQVLANSYVLNISIPSTIAGGNYSVYATAYDSGSGIRNSGTAKFDYLYVNSSALVIDAYNGTHDNDEFFDRGNRDLFVNVTNVGGGALFNVSLEVSLTGACTSVASGYLAAYNIGNLSGFRRYSNTSATWKITINANSTCTATIKGLGPPGVWILNDTLIYAYKGTIISSDGPGGGVSGGTANALSLAISTDKSTYFKASPVNINFTVTAGGSGVGTENALVKFNITDPKGVKVADSSCTITISKCSGSYTPAADVIGTFKISATATKDSYTSAAGTKTFAVAGYNATIQTYAKTIYVLQGNSNTTTVTVRNSGLFDSTMSLTIKDIDSSWFNVTPSKPFIATGQETEFNVNFAIPANAVVRNYTGKYSVAADSEIALEYFYLVVGPTEKTKSEINATVLNYTETLKALEARLNLTTFPAINSTELKIAGEKINLAASLLSQATDYLSKGDYVKANELAIQAKSLLDAAEALIKTVESGQGSKRLENMLFVAGTVAGVLLAGLLVYMFLPEPGYSSSKGYTIPEQAGKAGEVKQRFKKIENIVREVLDKITELAEKLSGKKGAGYNARPGA